MTINAIRRLPWSNAGATSASRLDYDRATGFPRYAIFSYH